MANIRDDELDFEGADHPPAEYADSEDEIRRARIPLEEMPGRLHRNIQEFKNQNSVTQAGQEIPNEIYTRPPISDEIKDREAGPSQNNSQEENRERLSPDPRLYKILADEMFAAIQGRGTSMIFRPQHFAKTARLLVDRGFHSVQAIKRMKTQLRTYFVDELKKAQVPTEDVRLVFELFDIFPPITRGSGKQHEFEEVCIPTALRRYTPDLSQLTGVIKPDQLMVNEISKQMTAAANTVPPYVPFVTVDLSGIPWRPTGSEHKRAHEIWKSRVRGFGSRQDISLQAWLLHSTRFIFSADLCGAWATFGGLAAQLSGLAVVLSMAVTESAQTAIEYDRKLRNYASEMARERMEGVNFSELISTENELIKRRVLAENAQEAQLRSKLSTNPGGKGKRSDYASSKQSWSAKSGKGSSRHSSTKGGKKGKNQWNQYPRGRSRSKKRKRSNSRPKSSPRDHQKKKTEKAT